ncbi:MAG: flagellar hook-basal body complex protein FliE [Actinomycetota bacterium]
MSISPIGPVSIPTPGTTQVSSVGAGGGAGITSGVGTGDGGGDLFSSVSDALQTVSDAHTRVDELSLQAATGDLTAVHELTMATAEAQLLTQLTVEVRNRAVESFNEIMRMQV